MKLKIIKTFIHLQLTSVSKSRLSSDIILKVCHIVLCCNSGLLVHYILQFLQQQFDIILK